MSVAVKAEELAISVMVECFEEYYKYCEGMAKTRSKTVYRDDAFFDTITFFAEKLKSRFPGFIPAHFYEACRVPWSPDVRELEEHASKILKRKNPSQKDVQLLAKMVVSFLDEGDRETKDATKQIDVRQTHAKRKRSDKIADVDVTPKKPSGPLKTQLGIHEPWQYRIVVSGGRSIPIAANSAKSLFNDEPTIGTISKDGRYKVVKKDYKKNVAYCYFDANGFKAKKAKKDNPEHSSSAKRMRSTPNWWDYIKGPVGEAARK